MAIRTKSEKQARERFMAFLRRENYRITSERFEILSAVLEFDEHFDAESLYVKLHASGSKVSRATVYKTLSLLHECGLVARYMFSPGEYAQYEKTVDRPRHDHMVCTRCGGITEFPNASVLYLQRQLCRLHDFEPTYHSFEIFGICGSCRAVERSAEGTAAAPGTTRTGVTAAVSHAN